MRVHITADNPLSAPSAYRSAARHSFKEVSQAGTLVAPLGTTDAFVQWHRRPDERTAGRRFTNSRS